LARRVERLFDDDALDAGERHETLTDTMSDLVRALGARARAGGIELSSLGGINGRLGAIAFAAALEAPYLAAAQHHADSRRGRRTVGRGFLGAWPGAGEASALVFTDPFAEANGAAGTMRQPAAAAADGRFDGSVVTAGPAASPGTLAVPADWVASLPGYESLAL